MHVLFMVCSWIIPVPKSLTFILICDRGRDPGFRFSRLLVFVLTSPSKDEERDHTDKDYSDHTTSSTRNHRSVALSTTIISTPTPTTTTAAAAASGSRRIISSRPDIQVKIINNRDIVMHSRLTVRTFRAPKGYKLSSHEPTGHPGSVS
jgi:hypothetical protein